MSRMTKKRPKTDPTRSKHIEAEYYNVLASLVSSLHAVAVAEARRATRDNYESVRQGIEYYFNASMTELQPRLYMVVRRAYGQGVKWSEVAGKQAGVGRHLGVVEAPDVEVALTFTFAEQRAIELLYKRNMDAVTTIPDSMKRDVLRIISDGVQTGKSISVITTEINALLKTARATAERIVRTETMYAVNQASLSRYADNGVKKVVWYAGQDERTCPVCGALDGKVFPVDKVPDIPTHPQCRCTVAPYLED